MPTFEKSPLNPNDITQSRPGAYQKKQFKDLNQHIIHHGAVLPNEPLFNEARNNAAPKSKTLRPTRSPNHYAGADPYGSIPVKPNQMTRENSGHLQTMID